MKKLLTLLSLFLGLGIMVNAQALYLPATSDTFIGDVISVENGIAAGDFVTNTGARNIVDVETGEQIGTNAGDFEPLTKVLELPNGMYYTYALCLANNTKVLVAAQSKNDSWEILPQAGFTPPNNTNDLLFDVLYINDSPGFWQGNQAPSGNEAKVFLLEGSTFVEKFDIPLSFSTMIGKVENVAGVNNQLFYHSVGTGYFVGDIVFDSSNLVAQHNQIDTRNSNNLRIVSARIVKNSSSQGELILGVVIKDEITNAFHDKIFSYNIDVNVPDSQKLTEVAEVYDLDGIELTPAENGFYLLQTSTDYQWIKFAGQSQQNFSSGIYFLPTDFDVMTEQAISDLDRIVGQVNDSYFYDNKLHYACNNNQLGLIYENSPFDEFGGMMILDLNPPFVPTLVSAFTSDIPATVYVGDVFTPNVSVASPATDSSFYVDVEEETGEVMEQDSGEFLATKAGTVTFTAYALDAGGYSQSWTVTILDTASTIIDSTSTSITALPAENFSIKGNDGSGWVSITTNDSETYILGIYNALGQVILNRTFESVIHLDISNHSAGIYYGMIERNGAILQTKIIVR